MDELKGGKVDLNQKCFKYLVYYPVVFLRGHNVPYYKKELLRTQYLDKEGLEKLQLAKLRSLTRYARQFVPFHRDSMPRLIEEDITSLRDIQKLPFTTKALVKETPASFLSSQPMFFLTKKTTGGSTGEPLTVWKTASAVTKELAATWRGYLWAGVDIGDRQARFWGIPFGSRDRLRAKMIDFVNNRKRCSAFAFDEKRLTEYTRMLNRFKPTYLYGYVSMLSEYAKYLQRTRTRLDIKLKCVITTSEVLTSHHKTLLESVFSTRVYNEYGSGELGSIAHECECGSLHVMAENMIMEVVNGDKVCEVGELGELVFTELNNLVMPLIRYRSGDFGVLSASACRCGRKSLPVIERLYGREYDMVRNRAGKLFHGEFFMYVFEEAKRRMHGVRSFQVIQQDYDHLRIKVVPAKGYGKDTEKFVAKMIRRGFDENAKIDFEFVNEITRAPSGKMRIIIGMENS